MQNHTFKKLLLLTLIIFTSVIILLPLDLKQKEEDTPANRKIYQKLPNNEVTTAEKNYLMGKFDPIDRKDFAEVPKQYTVYGNKMYLRKETLEAFLQMAEVADNEEVDLKISSATRNFNDQKSIWNNKWNGVTLVDGENLSKSIPDGIERFQKILEYSAAPGTSRHHFGTDIDINAATPKYFETKNGKKVYEWLIANAEKFGFCQTYNKKENTGSGENERMSGYNEEKWHWSYKPLSKIFTEEYKNLIKDEDIKGFAGDQYAKNFYLINNYVLAINPECL